MREVPGLGHDAGARLPRRVGRGAAARGVLILKQQIVVISGLAGSGKSEQKR